MQTILSRRLALSYLGFGALSLTKAGDQPRFPDWSPAYVDKLLTDSPWAQSSTLSFELRDERRFQPSSFAQIGIPRLPGGTGRPSSPGSTSVRTEIFLTTRWASALPIRQAMALSQFGESGLGNERARELLDRDDPEYVMEVAGFPATLIRQGTERFEAELLRSARLTVSSRPSTAAATVDVPPHGMHLMATLRFPRFADLAPKDGTIEVSADAGAFHIRQRFKLKDMMYGGRLEL